MHRYQSAGGIAAIVLLWLLAAFPARAQIDCDTLQHWSAIDNNLSINQKHVFCGEWDRNRPKGFHSRPDGINPDTIATFTVQDKANAAGVYTGRWSHKDGPKKNKFSSMFPDNCSARQVLNSIAHAAAHPSQCPAGAPDWTQCGFNQPRVTQSAVENSEKYCSQNNRLFTIGFAPPRNGRINTAFPLYE
ncbi:EndoU domain-containing protein [Nitrosomonas sp.]|uniref:EndoU domain-containing protein n=1 Tax=Nitrosomonas sp. TaxID=42353 RepID=UPI002842692B|nr:EndoU domain-containing protein [Nitrosomonas sp.]MCP5242785.1 EndoU domain-containing protein [Burkholderiales bacterium]MDR4515670.1 EndoU domain-containing protein [Nitrosomonas sp.]